MTESRTRDDRILDHIGLYRLSIRPIIERLFFDEKNCGNVIQRLLDQNRIQSREGLPRRMRYYQLSPNEAKSRGIPVHRTQPFGSQALNHHLAVLWFCNMGSQPRHLLEKQEQEKRFPEDLPAGAYCIERSPDGHRLYRFKIGSSDTDDTSLIRWLRHEITASSKSEALMQPMKTRQFGFGVLVDTTTRVTALQQTIEESSLAEDAFIFVEFAPSHLTLHTALNPK